MQHVVAAKIELKKTLAALRTVSTIRGRHMSIACTAIEDAVLRLDMCEREHGKAVTASLTPDKPVPVASVPTAPAAPAPNKPQTPASVFAPDSGNTPKPSSVLMPKEPAA